VANGADAIFFGMPRFNARMRADNFSDEDLPELMAFLHKHGVKGYVAFNTLIFTGELHDAEAQLRRLESAGVDAVIVQDLGLARMVKAITPRLRLHASTQMTITSPEGLEFARRLGIDQAVLARELSLRELERFDGVNHPELPLEVFVHGALCVAYSGQCLTSESLGRRSANRGECAQACRMTYEMLVDGEVRDLGDKRYLLSPQDLSAISEVPRLIELGIRSFKIEGRLKTPEYVAAVTSAYRKAIDYALDAARPSPTAEDRYAMEMTFSRGLYSGWMHGVNHQELVHARSGRKRGPLVGLVSRVGHDHVVLDEIVTSVKPGDGVVFENPADTDHEQGGRLYAVADGRLEFQYGKIRFEEIAEGTRVFKTNDPALDRRLRQSFEGDIPLRKKRSLDLKVQGREGAPLRVSCAGHVIESSMPLQLAQKRPLTKEQFCEQFGRLGGTQFGLGAVEYEVAPEVMLPVSELNRMRRALVEELAHDEAGSETPRVSETRTVADMLRPVSDARDEAAPASEATLFVLCRSFDHIEAALDAGVSRLYADFEDIRLYPEVVRRVRGRGGCEVFLATPRIQKSGESGFFKLIALAVPHGVLIRNLGAMAFFSEAGLPMTGDFSLNVANPLTAEFLRHAGLERLTISYDLNLEQVLDLLRAAPPSWFEITLHQHMPMFHMEHCAFAAFLSEGTDFTNCGRPCERHRVRLRDRVGMEHPLKADVGCRNTLFNAVAQTGARFFPELLGAGLRHYRLELLEEPREEAARAVRLYQELLAGRRSGDETWRELKAHSQLGVTRGTLAELV
jgi:putative protease